MLTLINAGLDVLPATIEVHKVPGGSTIELPGFSDTQAREVRVRLRSALLNTPDRFDAGRLPGGGVGYTILTERPISDLALAAAILGWAEANPKTLYVGDLSLSGEVHAVRGLLPLLRAAPGKGFTRAVVPAANAADIAYAPAGLEILTLRKLSDEPAAYVKPAPIRRTVEAPPSLADVRGQEHAKSALRGASDEFPRKGLLLIGPPGSGKTMLARRATSCLRTMNATERGNVASIRSVAGLLGEGELLRPFRAPHHTVSETGLIGDAKRPGEVSLAHEGVLFLDEVSEFRASALDTLRRVLAEGRVRTFPARPWIIAAANACGCGYAGASLKGPQCRCTTEQLKRHRDRLQAIAATLSLEEVTLEEVTLTA